MKTIIFLFQLFSVSAFQLLPAAEPRPFGSGTITRSPDGSTAVTTRYGSGTRTVITRTGKPTVTATTSRFGRGYITRTSTGKTLTTSRFGYQPAPRARPAKPPAKPQS